MTIENCRADNSSNSTGGGITAAGSRVLLTNGSVVVGGQAAGSGNALAITAGSQVVYRLPAPPGRWIAGTICLVYRKACPTTENSNGILEQDADCLRTASQCELEGNVTAVIDGVPCQQTTFAQPCDWEESPELIGSVVQVLPQAPLEEDFPFDCAAGMVGSAAPTGVS